MRVVASTGIYQMRRLVRKGACEGLTMGSAVPDTLLPGWSSREELGGRHTEEPSKAFLPQVYSISYLDGLGNEGEAWRPLLPAPLEPKLTLPSDHILYECCF